MSETRPDLHMLNLVVGDMTASLDFYRRLGVVAADGADGATAHVELPMPGGVSLELDTAESARLWHAGWRADPTSGRVVIGFALPTPDAVDERFGELTAAGYAGRQPPFDAFWGARFAIVADPDGNDVGLMSPIDPNRRSWPPTESPAGYATREASDVRQHGVQRPRHTGRIEGLDEQPRILDLAAAPGAHEAPQLGLGAPALLRRLLLQRAP